MKQQMLNRQSRERDEQRNPYNPNDNQQSRDWAHQRDRLRSK